MSAPAQLPGLRLAAPLVSGEDVDRLCSVLRGRGWIPSRQLEEELGITDRRIRQVAEFSRGRILSGPGSAGYRLTAEAAPEEIDRVAAGHESQGRHHLRRAAAIRAAARRLREPAAHE